MHIPFNKPYMTGGELDFIVEAHANGKLAGDGSFTKRCEAWLEENARTDRALLTHSCTAALEMAALLLDLSPGDEIIMPSYTFVSTANAFVLRGALPVFVDIREDTLNLDESKIENAITDKTRAIVVVHYAGVACEMSTILDIASRHSLIVVEDAAQGVLASYRGQPLGSIGDFGTYSFHETKNIISGEGGALLISDRERVEMAEIVREKGTNRTRFLRGFVDKYDWQAPGSSYLPGEIVAAFLFAQMQHAAEITERRVAIWNRYHDALSDLERIGTVRRPIIPGDCTHNAHMYYLLFESPDQCTAFAQHMSEDDIHCVRHYVPLHSAPAGRRHARASGDLKVTDIAGERLIRLPLWLGIESELDRVIERTIHNAR